MKVCKTRCKNCLFSKDKIVSAKRKKIILEDCRKRGVHFICHKAQGKDVTCSGFYKKLGHTANLIRIMERIGGIEFVTLPAGESFIPYRFLK